MAKSPTQGRSLAGVTYEPDLDAALDAVRMQLPTLRRRRARRLPWVRLFGPLLAGVGDLLIVLGCRLKSSVGASVPLQSLAQLRPVAPVLGRRDGRRP